MGMYTGLRCHVKLKEEFIPLIDKLIKEDKGDEYPWRDLGYNFTDEFDKIGRSFCIPFGSLAYMPWEDDDPEWQHSLKNDEWIFQCSLKNYESEIEYFLENVLVNIIDSVIYIETLYEENDVGDIYDLVDGKLKIVKEATTQIIRTDYYDIFI